MSSPEATPGRNGDSPNGAEPRRSRPRPTSLEDPRKRNSVLITYTLVAISIFLFMWAWKGQTHYTPISYTAFMKLVDEKAVKTVIISDHPAPAELTAAHSVDAKETPPHKETTTTVATSLGFKP